MVTAARPLSNTLFMEIVDERNEDLVTKLGFHKILAKNHAKKPPAYDCGQTVLFLTCPFYPPKPACRLNSNIRSMGLRAARRRFSSIVISGTSCFRHTYSFSKVL